MLDLRRIALGVRYDGTRYHGWQHQHGLRTVQGCLEQSLSQVANHPILLTCAGRTDAGVHASGQVVHFDTEAERSDYSWVFGANSNLPHDISVFWSKKMNFSFHARFSAVRRCYRYIIFNHSLRPGILRHAVAWHYRHLDVDKMHAAGQYLLGEHDFSAYRSAGCQSQSPVRRVYALSVQRHRDLVIIEIQANAFLLHMVRNIVGVLLAIGSESKPVDWAQAVLCSKERHLAAATAPPQGLYLVQVNYPVEFELPEHSSPEPFFLP